MNDIPDMLRESIGRMLADKVAPRNTVAAEQTGIDTQVWQQLGLMGVADSGAPAMGIEEHAAVLQAIGYAGALVPYAESEVLGRWLAQDTGIDTGDAHVLTLAVVAPSAVRMPVGSTSAAFALKGERIPWARHADRVLFSFSTDNRSYVALKPAGAIAIRPGSNLAGEPHDIVTESEIRMDAGDIHEVGIEHGPAAIRLRGALCRAVAMVGAMTKINELTLQYACDRKQFGRPISQFQIIQSYLAAMAGELCAASVLVDTAVAATACGNGNEEIAAAKIRVGQAARTMTSLGHQIHGAIGFTLEYPLNLWTRRLWAWREEYGNEADWAHHLGSIIVDRGADALWPRLTAQPGSYPV
ncbi:MAG: acyl-CoA dehydrogenase family protein [Sterolibacterium sp.]